MIHFHRWSRWRKFTAVTHIETAHGTLRTWRTIIKPMQEKTCLTCGKTKERTV